MITAFSTPILLMTSTFFADVERIANREHNHIRYKLKDGSSLYYDVAFNEWVYYPLEGERYKMEEWWYFDVNDKAECVRFDSEDGSITIKVNCVEDNRGLPIFE